METALCAAAMRGVDVRILIPEKPDHRIVWLASIAHAFRMISARHQHLPLSERVPAHQGDPRRRPDRWSGHGQFRQPLVPHQFRGHDVVHPRHDDQGRRKDAQEGLRRGQEGRSRKARHALSPVMRFMTEAARLLSPILLGYSMTEFHLPLRQLQPQPRCRRHVDHAGRGDRGSTGPSSTQPRVDSPMTPAASFVPMAPSYRSSASCIRKATRRRSSIFRRKAALRRPPGTRSTLGIDWDRRYQLMRLHTALHLLVRGVPLPRDRWIDRRGQGPARFRHARSAEQPRRARSRSSTRWWPAIMR